LRQEPTSAYVRQPFVAAPYFGPKAPAGTENNWVPTIPGKGWFMILRLYVPLKR